MVRLASTIGFAMLPMPALAAGGWADEPLQVKFFLWLAVLLVGGVPAAGVGFVIGSFLRLPASVLVLATLALVPTVSLWAMRGLAQAMDFAATPFVILLIFGPLIFIGWRFGRRDAIRHMARKGLPQNGI
jgi:hypothetical protein